MIKPRLWKYKSGAKQGHLRTQAKKYLSFKLKAYWHEHPREKIIYFVNFEIENTRGYIVGSLSSPFKIYLEDARKIIKASCLGFRKGYIPIYLYEAEEKGKQKQTLFILMREDNEIYSEVINV